MKQSFIFLLFVILFFESKGQQKQFTNENRTGLEGQFYFKNKFIPTGFLRQYGGSGRAATVGGGIPINYIHHLNPDYSIGFVMRL